MMNVSSLHVNKLSLFHTQAGWQFLKAEKIPDTVWPAYSSTPFIEHIQCEQQHVSLPADIQHRHTASEENNNNFPQAH